MIIPSIDISGGRVVQLIGGEELAIEAGDPRPILERFSVVGEVAVIDIDAARGEGDNSELIAELCAQSQIRVGGGIRDLKTARKWLDLGAARVILGTAATPDLLAQLPKDRVMVALDSRDGEVVSHGWRRGTGMSLLPRIEALTDLCGGFLVTFVELEGRLDGTDLDRAEAVARSAGETRVTLAGGITTAAEIEALDSLGMDAQVGMALYTGDLSLADSVGALLTSGSARRTVADRGGRRDGQGTRAGMVRPGEPDQRHRLTPWRLPQSFTRPMGQGGDFRGDSGIAGRGCRLRPRRTPFHGPSERWLLPHGISNLLG